MEVLDCKVISFELVQNSVIVVELMEDEDGDFRVIARAFYNGDRNSILLVVRAWTSYADAENFYNALVKSYENVADVTRGNY